MVTWIVSLALGVAVVASGPLYVDVSGADLAKAFVVIEAGMLVAIAVSTWLWLPALRAIEGWIRGGRRSAGAAEVWHRAVTLPLFFPRIAFPCGAAFVGLPLAIYMHLVLEVSLDDAAISFAAILAAGAYLALVLYFALELYVRPLLADIADHMPAELELARTATPLGRKLLAALLLISVATGYAVAGYASARSGSLGTLGIGLGLTVLVTASTTLLVSVLVTRSLVTPLGHLLEAIRKVSEGDLNVRVPVVSGDEVGLLTSGFNEMVVALERLQGEVRAQIEAVRESRRRIVEAGDRERRKLERNLHDGAQQRLLGLALGLRSAQRKVDGDQEASALLESAIREAQAALGELRELARGMHPPVLTEQGLGPALASLAEREPIPVRIERAPTERLPAPVEACAYFVCSEALQNVAKYAQASGATVRSEVTGGNLVVEVTDDGVGGAQLGRGTGLLGLRDRAEALGGTLTVVSCQGAGTQVTATIPIAHADSPSATNQG